MEVLRRCTEAGYGRLNSHGRPSRPRTLQTYLQFHKQEVHTSWRVPKLLSHVCTHIRGKLAAAAPPQQQLTPAGTTLELAVPAGAPPQQQQQLAAASTSRKREAPAANKPRAAKQAFLEALNAAHHRLALYPPHQIRTDSFSQAFFDYLRAIDRILSMPSLDAQTYRPNSPEEHSVTVPYVRSSQVSGVPQDGYVHCVAGDACNKPSSCGGVAKATRDLEQHTDTYLDRSGLEGAVQQLHDRTVGHPVQIGIGKGQAPTRLPSISLSADMAQLQLRVLRGPHKQRMAAAKLKCMELETAHGVHALEKEKHHGSAEGESPLIARGLKRLCCRYRTQMEQLTNDVHELMLQRDRMGQSDKDPCAASNAIKAIKAEGMHMS
ncbi:hypothetical protein QJQ45_017273 [Haematococcus lacustris]|nr:hypothetical protein QJQ45_017273 [Haematococcus lacustris]